MRPSILLLLIFGNLLSAHAINIKPGESHRTASGEVVTCEVSECVVDFQYVGKTYRVKLPNGKVYFESQKKEETLKAAKDLIDMKACDRLKIDIKD